MQAWPFCLEIVQHKVQALRATVPGYRWWRNLGDPQAMDLAALIGIQGDVFEAVAAHAAKLSGMGAQEKP
ncbi:hypothetical protein Hesp01_57420 [Herbidospora sp. NBRC 101105]|nr:hypothetical protein Hesp01_57420 [Herbidospora sp. NBRC 101105]